MAPNVLPVNDGDNSNGIGTGFVIGWILSSIFIGALGVCIGYKYIGKGNRNNDGLLREHESISMQQRRNHGSTDTVVTDCSDVDYWIIKGYRVFEHYVGDVWNSPWNI